MKNIEIYEKNILLHKDKNFATEYIKRKNCVEYVACFDGCELKVSIDTTTHVVDSAMAKCEDDSYKQGIMNSFVDLLIELPILEAHDHGVLRLERLLRDDSVVHPVRGVIMPGNSCELFNIPTNLIRAIYDQYVVGENYHPLVNTYRPKEIQAWKNMAIKDREEIISKKIENFCNDHKITKYDAKLIGDMRVEFSINKNEYPSLSKLLFDMEYELGKDLGFSLEIMFTEKEDANKKRKN